MGLRSLLLGAVVLAGCGSLEAPPREGHDVLVLEVAPVRVHCVGELEGMCLQVRTPDESEWRTFYAPIDGFRYESGVRYVLEVERRRVPDPPADASAFEYRLLRIVDEQRVEPPAPREPQP